MIRGVSCAVASCTATSTADELTTTRVNIEAATVPITVRAESTFSFISKPNARSIRLNNATTNRPAKMLRTGNTHIELRTYSFKRWRSSQLILSLSVSQKCFALKVQTALFSVQSLWLMNSGQKHTTETQRTQLHRAVSEPGLLRQSFSETEHASPKWPMR